MRDGERRGLQKRLGETQGEVDLSDETPNSRGHMWSRLEKQGLSGRTLRDARAIRSRLQNQRRQELSRTDKVAWEKEGQRLEAYLRQNLLPRRHVSLRDTRDPEFQRAVQHMARVENSPKFMAVVNRWKNIQRQLHPSDPSAPNLERLRRAS